MATSPSAAPSNVTLTAALTDSEYAKVGLAMWLNNAPDRAEQHFRAKLESTPIFAGYAFIVSMNGVIAYEMDKINDAQQLLKELERRCVSTSVASGWLSSVRCRIFGGSSPSTIPVTNAAASIGNVQARCIEDQIILADTFLSTAILTFLTQDITGLMRGSWLLRKAWKIYQSTYLQLYELFMQNFGDEPNVPPMPSNYQKPMSRSKSEYNYSTSISVFDAPNASKNTHIEPTASPSYLSNLSPQLNSNSKTATVSVVPSNNNTLHQATKTNHQCVPESNALHCDFMCTTDSNNSTSTWRRPTQLNLAPDSQPISDPNVPSSCLPSTSHSSNNRIGHERLYQHTSATIIKTVPMLQTCPAEPSEAFNRLNNNLAQNRPSTDFHHEQSLDEASVRRLMGAVSFGYGIFQLSASLLPLSLLRIISFFGFEGNRSIGVACLMFARLSDDMRAPLATLALLWFYTFGSQMLKYEDGYTTDQAMAASNLISETEPKYPNSSIFLFFRGRVERMKANSVEAVRAYQLALKFSAQKELRLLCLHEIAWCKLIQLDFNNAEQRFNELREVSIFSKAFYTYMTAICQGASGNFNHLAVHRSELTRIVSKSKQKDSHISAFVQNRIQLFPSHASGGPSSAVGGDQLGQTPNQFFWKYLVYEVLFLWSALSNASIVELTCIVADCSAPSKKYVEPMVGLQQLILGGVLVCLKQYQAAANAYRNCISQRQCAHVDEFHHVSAFAHYELALLLLQCSTDYTQESRRLLREALLFKGYDLENRLLVHIQKELKKLG